MGSAAAAPWLVWKLKFSWIPDFSYGEQFIDMLFEYISHLVLHEKLPMLTLAPLFTLGWWKNTCHRWRNLTSGRRQHILIFHIDLIIASLLRLDQENTNVAAITATLMMY